MCAAPLRTLPGLDFPASISALRFRPVSVKTFLTSTSGCSAVIDRLGAYPVEIGMKAG